MEINWVDKNIKEIKDWLSLNETQSFLPTMDIEDLLHKKDVACNKKILDILTRIKHHPKL